jgi:hypothetical protein
MLQARNPKTEKPRSLDEHDRNAVRGQLELVVAHAAFRNSPRCINLLRYVVEHTLKGDQELIKERTLGVEVFGRDAAYDNSQDPVVRVVATDVRKRLAQYYQEPGHEGEIRIQLNSGSYIPEFHFEVPLAEPQGLPATSPVPKFLPGFLMKSGGGTHKLFLALAVFAILLAGAVGGWWRAKGFRGSPSRAAVSASAPSVLDRFWSPLLGPSDRILLNIDLPPSQGILKHGEEKFISLSYLSTFTAMAEFMGRRGHSLDLRLYDEAPSANAPEISTRDIEKRPSIFIGDLANTSIADSGGPQRYYYRHSANSSEAWIEDRQDTSKREWAVNGDAPASKVTREYAILVRLSDGENARIYAEGMGEASTIAAADCLIDSSCINGMVEHLPKDWYTQNMEIVLAIPIISGRPGPPLVVASDFWSVEARKGPHGFTQSAPR